MGGLGTPDPGALAMGTDIPYPRSSKIHNNLQGA